MVSQQVDRRMALDVAPRKSAGVIVTMEGGRDFQAKASGRGLTPGAPLVVVQNYRVGPVVVFLRDSLIALGRDEARKIVIGNGEGRDG